MGTALMKAGNQLPDVPGERFHSLVMRHIVFSDNFD